MSTTGMTLLFFEQESLESLESEELKESETDSKGSADYSRGDKSSDYLHRL